MISLYRNTQVHVTHIRQRHPAQIFDDSDLLNIFAKQLILNALKGPGYQTQTYFALIYHFHQLITRNQTNLYLIICNLSVVIIH